LVSEDDTKSLPNVPSYEVFVVKKLVVVSLYLVGERVTKVFVSPTLIFVLRK
jgi:hypothetical protein